MYWTEGAIYSGRHYKHFFAIPVETRMFINKSSVMAWKQYSGPKIDSVHIINIFFPYIKFSKLEGLNIKLDQVFNEL
jgi:hypothetical protein